MDWFGISVSTLVVERHQTFLLERKSDGRGDLGRQRLRRYVAFGSNADVSRALAADEIDLCDKIAPTNSRDRPVINHADSLELAKSIRSDRTWKAQRAERARFNHDSIPVDGSLGGAIESCDGFAGDPHQKQGSERERSGGQRAIFDEHHQSEEHHQCTAPNHCAQDFSGQRHGVEVIGKRNGQQALLGVAPAWRDLDAAALSPLSPPKPYTNPEAGLSKGPMELGTMKLTVTIYGIKNCDTMKKARAWLDSHGVAYGFHDYKTAGIAKDKLKRWSDELGWETLLNRAGTTFRKLPDGDKQGLNERKALALMLAQPSMIKRPVLDLGGRLLVGFKPEIYAREVDRRL
jgi:arsenate reductase